MKPQHAVHNLDNEEINITGVARRRLHFLSSARGSVLPTVQHNGDKNVSVLVTAAPF